MDDDAVEVRWVVGNVVGKFDDDIGSPYIKLNCGTVVGGSCWLMGIRLVSILKWRDLVPSKLDE